MNPLVVELGAKTWAYVEGGRMWLSSGGPWVLADSAPGIGGRVLTASETAALLEKLGRPT